MVLTQLLLTVGKGIFGEFVAIDQNLLATLFPYYSLTNRLFWIMGLKVGSLEPLDNEHQKSGLKLNAFLDTELDASAHLFKVKSDWVSK